MAGATWNCCRLGASSVYTIHTCTSLQCHFIRSHIGRVHVFLAVTCHLHFWQNTSVCAVARGWNGSRNKSEHRTLALEQKILPPLPLANSRFELVRLLDYKSIHKAIKGRYRKRANDQIMRLNKLICHSFHSNADYFRSSFLVSIPSSILCEKVSNKTNKTDPPQLFWGATEACPVSHFSFINLILYFVYLYSGWVGVKYSHKECTWMMD